MELFGVGPLEFLLVLVLALVIMGPQDMVGTARKLGQWIYRVVRSPTWRAIITTTQDLRELPQKIVREAGIEEAMQEVKETASQVKSELNATTTEISNEMRAAGNAVSSEMGVAVDTVKSDAILPAPLPVANTSFSVWPENILDKHDSMETPSVAEIIRTSSDPYNTQLGFFAEALQIGPKPELDLDNITPPVEPPPPPPPPLRTPEVFGNALGSFFGLSYAQSKTPDYETGPVMPLVTADSSKTELEASEDSAVPSEVIAAPPEISSAGEPVPPIGESLADTTPPPADWAQGISTGLSESALEERTKKMMQAIERLDQQASGDKDTADPSPAA